MSKQAVFYEKVTPVSKQKHIKAAVKSGDDYLYAKEINAIPVTAVEIPSAANEYAIAFSGSGENLMPILVLGVMQNKNHYVDQQGKWKASYIPACVRRYPFVYSSNDDGKTLFLCIDESFSGYNEEGRGERLFDVEGEQTQYLNGVLNFQNDYQSHINITRAFSQKIQELDLLEPVHAQFKTPQGKQHAITGLQIISRKKLNALTDEQLIGMARSGELELIYLHLHSLHHIKTMAAEVEDQAVEDNNEETPEIAATEVAGPDSQEKIH